MTRLWAMVLGTVAVSALASLRAIVLYLPPPLRVPGTAGMIAAGVLGCILLLRGRLRPRWVLIAASVLMVIVAGAIYPSADARSQMGLGSDQDDALRDMASGIMAGRYPFATPTYLDNPPSPGPVWVLLHVPFVAAGAYILAPVVALALGGWTLARTAGGIAAAGAGVILGTSPVFWEAVAIGSDQVAVGCASAILLLLAVETRATSTAIGVTALAVAVGTARAVFPFVPAAIGLVARGHRLGSVATLSGAALAVIIHLALFQWGPGGYGPMHVFGEAAIMLPGWQASAGAAATLATLAVVMAIRPRRIASQMAGLGVVLAVPLILMMVVRSAEDFSDIASWGANYVVPAVVVLAAATGLAVAEVARNSLGKVV